MKKSEEVKRIKITLFLLFFSSTAYGESLFVCQNQTVPVGYAVVQRDISSGDCGGWNNGSRWILYSKMMVTKLDVATLTICDGHPQTRIPPTGYIVVARNISGARCGSWNNGSRWIPYTGITIKKLN